MTDTDKTCMHCAYYTPEKLLEHINSGFCHRYPRSACVDFDYWCGEFRGDLGNGLFEGREESR